MSFQSFCREKKLIASQLQKLRAADLEQVKASQTDDKHSPHSDRKGVEPEQGREGSVKGDRSETTQSESNKRKDDVRADGYSQSSQQRSDTPMGQTASAAQNRDDGSADPSTPMIQPEPSETLYTSSCVSVTS